MTSSAAMFTASLDAAVAACTDLASRSAEARTLPDAELMGAQRTLAAARRQLEATLAVLAGETLTRSARQAGLDGLARKEGFRTPEALLQHTTGATSREAATLVKAGSMVNDAAALETNTDEPGREGMAPATAAEPWLAEVGKAIRSGTLSVAQAEAIRNGLGRPGPGVEVETLARATEELLRDGAAIPADNLFRQARQARESLDAEGIASREQARRAQRSLRRWRKPGGMTRYTWELDPEGAALVDDIYDAITSPRRGGPRFVDEADRARAERIVDDVRTTEQLASDGLLSILKLGADADDDPDRRSVLGRAKPAVRILVAQACLDTRQGNGRIEGHPDAVSIETVERYLCDSGAQEILFDAEGNAIDVGRDQRLFTPRQRLALAARDGGCLWPGCERPPAWCEAHHVKQWGRDGGRTDLSNGILLCRHHHLLLHDNHWEIQKRGTGYWLLPPPGTSQVSRPLQSKSAALHDLRRRELEHRELEHRELEHQGLERQNANQQEDTPQRRISTSA